MRSIITAVGPDHRGLADPIVHCVTRLGANIAEIQMYDHDQQSVFSMLTRIEIDPAQIQPLREAMLEVSERTGLSIRTWSPPPEDRRPRLAICCTYRPETPRAILAAIQTGAIEAEATALISNRKTCHPLGGTGRR